MDRRSRTARGRLAVAVAGPTASELNAGTWRSQSLSTNDSISPRKNSDTGHREASNFGTSRALSSSIDVLPSTTVDRAAVTARRLAQILRRSGCEVVRQKGSHQVWRCRECQTVVPVHSGDIPKGTLRSIERDLEPCLGPKWLTS